MSIKCSSTETKWEFLRSKLFDVIREMKHSELYSKSGIGWIYSLAATNPSNWGDIESFYNDMETYDKSNGQSIFVESTVWGKIKNSEKLLPAKGDGLALYHSSRALRYPDGPKITKPRVSLIGQLIDIQYEDSYIKYIKVEVQLSVLKALKSKPIERDDSTRETFKDCGITRGVPYALYNANNNAWRQIIAFLNERI